MNIKDFQIYIRDSLQHIDLMKSRHPDLPVFIVGHSMVRRCYVPSWMTGELTACSFVEVVVAAVVVCLF